MKPQLKSSDIHHLRRLLGWVRCEIGQSPEENISTVQSVASAIGEISDEAKVRLVEHHKKLEFVPLYIRKAVKALEKVIADESGEVVDATEKFIETNKLNKN